MRTITFQHMTYTQIDFDNYECHNAITGKTWIVNRRENPLGWAHCLGQFAWAKDKAAGMTFKQHLAECDREAQDAGMWFKR